MIFVLTATAIGAQTAPRGSALEHRVFRDPALSIAPSTELVASSTSDRSALAREALAAARIPATNAHLDRRSGRFSTLILSIPLLPGSGVGNRLHLPDPGATTPGPGGDSSSVDMRRLADQAFRAYLEQHREALRIQPDELGPSRITLNNEGELIQLHIPRTHRGVPVRDSYLTAVINHGNLVLLGAKHWGTIDISTQARVPGDEAVATLISYLAPLQIDEYWKRMQLEIVPTVEDDESEDYRYRLVWVLRPRIEDDPGRWEALIGADNGEILSLLDTNVYDTPRKIVGGVYTSTNDGSNPGGLERDGYPAPYANAQTSNGEVFADSGGNLSICVDGDITTTLDGLFAQTDDFCGELAETASGDLDLGTSAGNDCQVPTGASAGNTHSSRTVYYTLNRMREVGRGQLPGNVWLDEARVPAISNFPSESFLGCNAIWDGIGVLFTTSSPGNILLPVPCSNTGELPSVVAHEWAHGLDDNDANGNVSNPPEGIADVMPALWFNDSCIGRGFFEGTACSSAQIPDGLDECQSCDGVREIDWRLRANNAPHDIAYIDTNCPFDLLGAGGPCGGSVHCEGHLVSESAWDLSHHDLVGAPLNLDANTALELTASLFYVGSGLVGDWFQCTPGAGTGDGCNADGGYLNLLAADDDNGDLTDGTPHMSAISAAFARHGIACGTPTVQNSGCADTPSVAPVVSVQALDRGARVTWTAVPDATRYAVYRNEGVATCSTGKARIGETTELTFVDQGLLNGFNYNYMVIPIGASDTCMGPASSCTSVTPASGANLGIDRSSASLTFLDGDEDGVVDNCETVQLSFDVHNIGAVDLNNVAIIGVDAVTPSGQVTLRTNLPSPIAASMGPCAVASASFHFLAQDLGFNQNVDFRVRLSADEMAGVERTAMLRFGSTESDFETFATKTFDFETDLEGWEVVDGTFDRTDAGGGAESSAYYLASSNDLPNQCDQLRSPLMRLQATSTLSAWTNFDIEPLFPLEGTIFWFDRANVAVVDPLIGSRTPIVPDGGRAYNAAGTDGTCSTANQEGWAGSMPTWAESTWSAAALGSAALANQTVQLDVGFGTDDGNWDGMSRDGFWIDRITVTDLELLVEDSSSNSCDAPFCIVDSFCDPFEDSCSCAADCGAKDQVIENMSIDTIVVLEACNSITVGSNVTILPGGHLTLDTPSVVLHNGLSVLDGATFQAGD